MLMIAVGVSFLYLQRIKSKIIKILHHIILLTEENPAPPGMKKTLQKWDIYHINWCRISSINSIIHW